jgi:energy-coupling factor transporter ATP-binding protein EcfA2
MFKMEVKDLSWNDVKTKRVNSQLLPKSIRGLLVGKSGCGKTTLLLNLLLRPDWLDYNSLQVFGKSLFQPEYKIIKKAFEEKLPKEAIIRLFDNQCEIMAHNVSPASIVEEMAKNLDKPADIECNFFETSDDVPDPRDLNSTKKNLMIFDDLQLEKQSKCETYYIRGRHSNVDCFYLAQNYFKLPRQTIRENANFICLFPQDLKNVNHIYNDHVSTDMPKEEFRKLCKVAWECSHRFVVIDLTSKKDNGKYRSGLDCFYIPESAQPTY